MLVRLHIENIAVIERADMDFDTGFSALTGETGAGKSIVIDAINAVLGERVNRMMVRSGSESAHVTALFSALSKKTSEKLAALGFGPDEEGNLLIGRTVTAEGKSTCTVNGRPTTAALLREIGKLLVDLHGQHENQALLSPENHMDYLDRFGALAPQKETYTAAYARYCAICRQLAGADMDETQKAKQLDLLSYQIQEIEAAALRVGEEEELLSRRTLCRNYEKVAQGLRDARAFLLGGENGGAVSLTEQAADALENVSRYLEEAKPLSEQLKEALYTVRETADELRTLTDGMDFDPRELDKIEERLERIHRLKSKYGTTEEEILAYAETCREERENIELSDERVRALTAQKEAVQEEVLEAAGHLTDARVQAAAEFSKRVQKELSFLDMPNVTVTIDRKTVSCGANGADKMEILLSANVGEPPRPLAKIASGGELSRIMLAIKSVLANADEIDTLIFDEIDTGISGRAAQKVGIKLRQTAGSTDDSRHRQILCVTHLAQIAAQAHGHYLIRKSVRDGRTFTDVTRLDTEKREEELARIIGGTVTDVNRLAAREMLRDVES